MSTSTICGEQRLRSLGCLDGCVVVLVWTEREAGPHLISCRYGDKYETKRYFQVFFSQQQVDAALAAASEGKASRKDAWANAIATHGGGVKATLAELRRALGAQKAPLKVPTTIRFDADVFAELKASGKGWQTRVPPPT